MSKIIRNPKYELSHDYKELASIVKESSVVCLAQYLDTDCVDVYSTIYDPEGGCLTYQISARGICLFFCETEEEFIRYCNKYLMGYIDSELSRYYPTQKILEACQKKDKALNELSGKVEQLENSSKAKMAVEIFELKEQNAKLVELVSDAYEEGWYYPEMYKDKKDPDFDKSYTKKKLEKIMKGEE